MKAVVEALAPEGLTGAEAAARLQRDGPNELPSAKPRPLWRIAADVGREPMFLLLIATGAFYVLLGDPQEAAALLIAVLLVIVITLYQERKTERALHALGELSSPRALVVRDGVASRIPGREVVAGDLVVLREGDRVPADAAVIGCTNLFADESMLTGESASVHKVAGPGLPPHEPPGGEDRPFVYSGTLIVRGDGMARVYATGPRSEIGRIGSALSSLQPGRTPLQREVDRIVRVVAIVGFFLCVTVAVVYGISRERWIDGILAGLTLAISMVPEEFPVVLTVFLALGAWRISRHNVLTRRVPAIETLGAASVLCVDKTGTLTLNRMTVAAFGTLDDEIVEVQEGISLPERVAPIVSTAILASRREAFDPIEQAINALDREGVLSSREKAELLREYPLSDALFAVTYVWRNQSGRRRVAMKGAPEAVARLSRLSADQTQRVRALSDRMAHRGWRVLGVAGADWPFETLPELPADFSVTFLGLIAFADPIRPHVPSAIAECRDAGIRVVMVTGDYPATAMNIARQAGLCPADGCVTGEDISRLDDPALAAEAEHTDVYARVVPAQKLRLVTALQSNGHVVAMTGDGVNDAPALRAADIGIAMGGRGTDVAREAASLILVDDDFESIVRAVRLGRRIYDNIEKATAYVLAIHVPIAGVTLTPVLFGWPLVLLPVHVIFMELIVDPACSIAFEMEREEPDVMRRPPRDPAARLFTPRMITRSVLQGLGALAASIAVLVAARAAGYTEDHVRTVTFSSVILTNLALIFTNRSLTQPVFAGHTPNHALRWLTIGACALLAAVLFVPFLQDVFKVAAPNPFDLLAIAVAAGAALAWMEGVKHLVAKKSQRS